MCISNHIISQFILKKFGKEINVYDRQSHILRCQQKTEEHYCERGLYDNYVENELNLQMEQPFARILNTPGGLEKLVTEHALFVRKFAFVSFLRTRTSLLEGKDAIRQSLLEQVLSSGYFPTGLHCEDPEVQEKVNRIQQFFAETDMELVKADEGEKFIISDVWPVVNNYDNLSFATLVLGPDASVFFHRGKIDRNPVCYSNYLNLIQCRKELTFHNVKDMISGANRFKDRGKDVDTYGPLFEWVFEVRDAEKMGKFSPYQREVIEKLSPRNMVIDLIFEEWDPYRLVELSQASNLYNLTALVVLHRFGLAPRLQLFDWHHLFATFSDEDLRGFVTLYSVDGDSEFAKCQAMVCSEILAIRGDAESQEKMARHYRDGDHVPKDEFLSLSYFASAARNGYADAICQMIIHCLKKDDLQTAMKYFEFRRSDEPALFFHIGRYKIENENRDEGLGYMERAAFGGYEGAFSYLFKCLRKYPLDYSLERAECLVPRALSIMSNGIMVLVKVYEEQARNKPVFEDKLEDLICRMEERGFREVEELRKRHPAKH